MRRFLLLFIIFCLFIPQISFAQGEANNWYFGRKAGVTFNTSPPTELSDGELSTNEGCSSISDASGNLLFYTDGRTVWNREHQIMSNADYFNNTGLMGDPSSTSSALIVPNPLDPNIYYVFTVDEPHHDNAAAYPNQGPANQDGTPTANGQYTDATPQNPQSVPQDDDGFNNGLNYSVVDMRLNGGLGNVVSNKRNLHLITYDPNDSEAIKYKCSEKITAVKGKDCNSIWVITQFIDTFYAFKIDDSGVNTAPVTSEVGPTIPLDAYRRASIGYLKASPDGKNLLIAHNTKTFNPVTNVAKVDGGVYLYDFNDETGKVSNNQRLVDEVTPYGVEFSMDSKKAYATASGNQGTQILQWDLTSSDIPSSELLVAQIGNSASAIQLAPNGKIYLSIPNRRKLAVINHPERIGEATDYSESFAGGAIKLSANAYLGLPPFIQSIFSSRVNIVDEETEQLTTALTLCGNETATLEFKNMKNTYDVSKATYTWFKEEKKIATTDPKLNISKKPGTEPQTTNYKLSINLNDGSCPLIGVAKVTFNVNPDTKDASLTQCSFMTANTSIFDLTDAKSELISTANENKHTFTFYRSSSDAQSGQAIENPESFENNTTPQTLVAEIIDTETGCSSYAKLTLKVTDISLSSISLSSCPEDSSGIGSFNLIQARKQLQEKDPQYQVDFYSRKKDAVKQENRIENENNFTNTTPFNQTIYARVSTKGACTSLVAINLNMEDYIELGLDKEVIYCQEDYPQKINLSPKITRPENYTYVWQPNGKTTNSIQVNEPGRYTVQVTNRETGCSNMKAWDVKPSNIASFQVKIKDLAEANSLKIVLSNKSIGDYEFTLDDELGIYQDSPVFERVKSGKHQVYVRDKNGCGTTGQTVQVLGFMKFFTPNNDGFNDRWKISGSTEQNLNGTTTQIFDRYGKLLRQFRGDFSGWDGTFNGHPLPSDEYWFLLKFKDGTEFKGHFTLKR